MRLQDQSLNTLLTKAESDKEPDRTSAGDDDGSIFRAFFLEFGVSLARGCECLLRKYHGYRGLVQLRAIVSNLPVEALRSMCFHTLGRRTDDSKKPSGIVLSLCRPRWIDGLSFGLVYVD